MQVLTVASPWLGGSGTVGFEIAEHLSKKHHSFFVSFNFPYRQAGKNNFLLLNAVPATYSLFPYPLYQTSLAEKIVEIVLRYGIELIHAHYSIVFGESAVMAKKILERQGKTVGTVLTFHGSDAVGFSPENPGSEAFGHINRYLVAEADCVTAASKWLAGFIKRNYAPQKKEIFVIPNFYDTDSFGKVNDFSKRRYFLHVSNFRKVKRPIEVVKAFQLLTDKVPTLRLIMVGDGPERKAVFHFVKSKKISGVSLLSTANKEELSDLYNQSLALILPSSFENFPLTVLEAAACGVPTIAAGVGGLPEIVKEGRTGFLVEAKANKLSYRLTEKMLSFAKPKLWEDFSQRCVHFASQFTKDKIVSRYEKLYRQLPLSTR